MELLQSLYMGFSTAIAPMNLLFCFVGVLVGTLVGVLPGLGTPTAIAILLPATFYIPPASALIMVAGIYYGAQFGGSTTSILVNIPGEATSVVTCLDGYQMARNGRAGAALGICAFGSFIGGSISVILLMLLGPVVANYAIRFGPPEFFSLTLVAVLFLIFFTTGSRVKGFMCILLGLFTATIGVDIISGVPRYTLGSLSLMKGVDLVPVAIGLFGIPEILGNLEESLEVREIFKTTIKGLLPTRTDWKDSIGPIIRGSIIGFFLGLIPGGGAVIATFSSYVIEKRVSRRPESFGTGVIEGVAGPETANNAAVCGGMVPLFSLGIPTNVVTALLLGAMVIHGVHPGPLFIKEYPSIFWAVIASMYVGNVLLLVLNLPLIGMWVKILRIPYRILFPLILLFCLLGAYTVGNDANDILTMLIFGALGYVMRKTGFEPILFVFAMVVGPIMENGFRQAMLSSRGHFSIFFTRPISAAICGLGLILFLISFVPTIKERVSKLGDAL